MNRIKKIVRGILKSHLFQFMSYGYRSQYSHWESWIFLKKLLIACLTSLNQLIGEDIVNAAVLFFLFFHLYLQLKIKPFVNNSLNKVETVCLLCSISIVMLLTILKSKPSLITQYICCLTIVLVFFGCLLYTAALLFVAFMKSALFKQIKSCPIFKFKRKKSKKIQFKKNSIAH